MMTTASPEEVIRDYLTASHVTTSARTDASGWRAETGTGGMDTQPRTLAEHGRTIRASMWACGAPNPGSRLVGACRLRRGSIRFGEYVTDLCYRQEEAQWLVWKPLELTPRVESDNVLIQRVYDD